MGVFFSSSQVTPAAQGAIKAAIQDALQVDPAHFTLAPTEEATNRTDTLAKTIVQSPQFNTVRFIGALVISIALLGAAIWAKQHNLDDISMTLMNSFTGFSGIVLGLLGGEAQQTTGSGGGKQG